MNILVTGGTGYIGSHTVVELLNEGHKVVIFDNLSNSKEKVLDRIEEITKKSVKFYKCDMLDKDELNRIFYENNFDCVIHFAGLKAVGESVKNPLLYYNNNVCGTLNLLDVMSKHNVKKLIFSSSATVYGKAKKMPITEDCPKGECTNPYGQTKSIIEQILTDLYASDNDWNIIILRYFNPIGAHPSGLIGEDPKGIPNNLCPYITQVLVGKRKELNIFGNDYNTPDGTGVRDYIHVVDLAKGHVLAVNQLIKYPKLLIINLGTGRGYSVFNMIHSFEKVSGKIVPYKILPRRPGDIDECYTDPSLAEKLLGFKATMTLDDMCRDAMNWQMKNPNGYDD